MCDPVSITMGVGAALSAVGQVTSGISQRNVANYEATVADRNSKAATEQARISDQNTSLEAQRRYRQLAQTKGNQQASLAANGVDINFGTSLDLQRDTAMIGAEDIGQIYKSGADRTKGYDIEALNYHSQAASDRAKGSSAFTQGLFGAASTALGAASQISKYRKGG